MNDMLLNRNFFYIIFLFFSNSLFCQINLEFKVLITIDNDPIVGIYNLFFYSEKDTIKAKYELGRIIIKKNDYDSISKSEKLIMIFKTNSNCIKIPERLYSINLEPKLIEQEYLFLRIYNFESFPKVFSCSYGYGYEYDSPIGSSLLPTKRKKNYRKPKDCYD